MKAIILAAGKGTRLLPITETIPKGMLEITPGKTIIDLIISNLEEIGIKEIIIVTRPKFSHLFNERYGVRVKIVETEYEEFGNLHSLETVFKQLDIEDDEVLVIMSDHIFEVKMLRKLIERKKRGKLITICVDKNPPWYTIQEGLKIRLDESKVIDLGKDVPPHHGTDTGLFIFSKEIQPFIQEVINEYGPNAEIITLLKRAKDLDLIGYVDVTGCTWIDIDTPQDLEKAKELYWKILRKNLIKPTDGPISKYINRPISTRVSLYLYKKGVKISPNSVTILIFLLGLISTFILAQGKYVIGGLMVFIISILDGVDGELARLKNETTAFGGFLDSVLDRYIDLMIILSLVYSFGWIKWIKGWFEILVLILASAGVFMHSYIVHVAKFRGLDVSMLEKAFPFASRDVRLFIVTLFCLVSLPLISLILLAILPLIYTILAFLLLKEENVQLTEKITSKIRLPSVTSISYEYKVTEKNKILSDIKNNINILFLNIIKLMISLFIINLLHYFDEIILLEFGGNLLTTTILLNLANMIVIIIFGYRILLALNFFMSIISDYIVRRFEITLEAYRRLALNFIYLFIIALIWIGVLPAIKSLAGIGEVIGNITVMILLAALSFIAYDIVRIFYRSLMGIWNKLVEKILKFFEKILIHHE
ncbi:MAG: sugar phosphate nucleotidyltransferase [Candidatus Aenigmatarchaeota archaeon]